MCLDYWIPARENREKKHSDDGLQYERNNLCFWINKMQVLVGFKNLFSKSDRREKNSRRKKSTLVKYGSIDHKCNSDVIYCKCLESAS